MTNVLMSLDPIKAGSKLREAARNLGDSKKEVHPWLLVAARRAQKLGLEHPTHGTPLVSEEVATYIDDTLIHQSSLGSQYDREAEVASMHESIAKTTEKALTLSAEAWDFDQDFQGVLAAMPADGAEAAE